MPKPILKSSVRILRPAEYEPLREGAGTFENQTRSDVLLLTGLRFIEAQRMQTSPGWIDGRFEIIFRETFAKSRIPPRDCPVNESYRMR
jgi:hypothetical protein